MTIVIAGGSGFIGTQLVRALLGDGHTVIVVDLKAPSFTHQQLFFIQCDLVHQPLPFNILEHTDAVVNLAGEPILGKWTDEKKKAIKESRMASTKHIVESIASTTSRPTTFVCASAIGFYGDTGEDLVDEQRAVGNDFLAEVVSEWEATAREAMEYGVRVVCVRTAPVIGVGGLLNMILSTARFGFLMNPTKENPWMSWIHSKDIVNVYRFAIQETILQGVINASAPEPVHMHDFMKAVSEVFHRPIIGTVPKKILTMKYGEMYNELVKSQQVLPRRLIDKGFEFEYTTIQSALTEVFNTTHTK